ncbi:MAG: transcriptional repressor [Clostridia bacterium]|nr:transcriptional repressor [Clostridia bacterium]
MIIVIVKMLQNAILRALCLEQRRAGYQIISGGGAMENVVKVGERRSACRDAIYETLKSTKSHPCAEWVYERVNERLPVGIATVYRNLKQLESAGLIVAIETNQGSVHYDADVSTHGHFICEECGKIIDVDLPPAQIELAQKEGFEVKRSKVVLYGKCPNCAGNSK